MSGMSKTVVWALASGLFTAAVAAPAQAKTERVTGGHATVTPSAQITRFLRSHTDGVAKLTAIVNGKRIVLATMPAPKVKMSARTGTMSGGLRLTATWAHLINHLVGMPVVHRGEDIGDLTARVRMS